MMGRQGALRERSVAGVSAPLVSRPRCRFSPAGAPDSEFNGTGNVELTTASVPFGIETLSDGRIMVAAYEQTGTSYDLRIARIWP